MLRASSNLEVEAVALARALADGPWFAHGITKTMMNQEWVMGIDEMIESEAQAQAICMATVDLLRPSIPNASQFLRVTDEFRRPNDRS